MKIFFTGILLTLSLSLLAQHGKDEVYDVVRLNNDHKVIGTILEYDYGSKLVILERDGSIREVLWRQLNKVTYGSQSRTRDRSTRKVAVQKVVPDIGNPARRWYHHVEVGVMTGVASDGAQEFEITRRLIGLNAAYHHLRRRGRFVFGAGAEYALFSYSRGEASAALLGTLEYGLRQSGKKLRPYLRLQGGAALPLTLPTSRDVIESREISSVVHPSLGIEITTGQAGFNSLFWDIGYRAQKSEYSITTPSLELLDRTISYSRFTVRAGYRF